MKKVLILAYDFPPYVSVGGLRPYSWYKYFHEFGLYPVVVTRQWGNKYGNHLDYIAPGESTETIIEETEFGTIIRTPYKPNLANRIMLKYGDSKFSFIRKAITAYYEFAQFLFFVGTKSGLYFGAKKYLKENRVDCIIATGEPFVLFKYASKLNSKFNIPWIADYRDPWSQDKGRQHNALYTRWNRYLEQKIVAKASCLITVSEFFKFKLKELFPKQTIHVLPNGYDPSVIEKVADLPQTTKELTISFIGTIYNWHPWQSFLEQFSIFLESNPEAKIKLNFYGINISHEVNTFIQPFPRKTQEAIHIFPKIPNQELLERLSKENVMLLFNYYSFQGTKIYDYIGLKRKIILCYANDPKALALKDKYYSIEEMEGVSQQLQVDLLQKTNAGVIVKDEAHLQKVFQELVEEFNTNGKIACASVGSENYSRKIQVKKLAAIIQNIP